MNFISRTIRIAAITLAATLAVPYIAEAQGVALDEPAFSVTLPAGYAEFTKQAQKTKSPEGEIETTNWISKAPTGEAVIVTVSHMPAKILDPQKLIAGTRDSLLKALGATLESETPRAGELPSVRLLFRSQAAVFRGRLAVNDDSVFQLLYVGRSDEQRSNAAVDAIFHSFELKTPANTVALATP